MITYVPDDLRGKIPDEMFASYVKAFDAACAAQIALGVPMGWSFAEHRRTTSQNAVAALVCLREAKATVQCWLAEHSGVPA